MCVLGCVCAVDLMMSLYNRTNLITVWKIWCLSISCLSVWCAHRLLAPPNRWLTVSPSILLTLHDYCTFCLCVREKKLVCAMWRLTAFKGPDRGKRNSWLNLRLRERQIKTENDSQRQTFKPCCVLFHRHTLGAIFKKSRELHLVMKFYERSSKYDILEKNVTLKIRLHPKDKRYSCSIFIVLGLKRAFKLKTVKSGEEDF